MQVQIDIASLVVWLIVGALGGYIAGIIVRMRQRGFGVVGNILIGLIGAFIGGFIFQALNISVLENVIITANDVIAAVVGSLILVVAVSFIRR